MATHEQVGKTLAKIRIDTGRSRAFIGGALGVSYASVRRMEMGDQAIDYPRLHEWLGALGVTFAYFDQMLARVEEGA